MAATRAGWVSWPRGDSVSAGSQSRVKTMHDAISYIPVRFGSMCAAYSGSAEQSALLCLIPLRSLPVPDHSVVSALGTTPHNVPLLGRNRSLDRARASAGPAPDASVVAARRHLRRLCPTTLNAAATSSAPLNGVVEDGSAVTVTRSRAEILRGADETRQPAVKPPSRGAGRPYPAIVSWPRSVVLPGL